MSDASSQAAPAGQQATGTGGSAADAGASQVNPNAGVASAGSTGVARGGDTNPVDMGKIFGDDFTKDPALSKFKDPKAFAQSYKELQAQVGKPRYDVPGQDTPAEQSAEFYKKLGVPENAEGYGLKADANVAEHNNEANVSFLKAFGEKALELKMTNAQVAGMQKFFDDLTVTLGKQAEITQAAEDAQLDSLFEKALGADKTVAAERIKALIEKVIPQDMRNLLTDKVSNEALTAIALLEKHFRETYGQSDKNAGDANAGAAGKNLADLRKEASELYSQMMKDGLTHPSYKANKEKYDALYKTIGELTKAAK